MGRAGEARNTGFAGSPMRAPSVNARSVSSVADKACHWKRPQSTATAVQTGPGC
jgi:hypothetical protein